MNHPIWVLGTELHSMAIAAEAPNYGSIYLTSIICLSNIIIYILPIVFHPYHLSTYLLLPITYLTIICHLPVYHISIYLLSADHLSVCHLSLCVLITHLPTCAFLPLNSRSQGGQSVLLCTITWTLKHPQQAAKARRPQGAGASALCCILIVSLVKGIHLVNQAQRSARGNFSRVLDQESGSLEVITGATCSSEMPAADEIYL